MGFPKDISDKNGLNKKFGNAVAADENSNVNWQKGGDKINTIGGRLKFGKSNVSSLNTGVGGCRDDMSGKDC